MLGPAEQPWEIHATEIHRHKQRGSLESLSKSQTNGDPQPNARPAGRPLAREEGSPSAGGESSRMLQLVVCVEGRGGCLWLHLLLVAF